MSRLPFKTPENEGPKRPARERPALTVSELSALVKAVLAEGVPGKVRVVGEVSNFSERSHWFFSLKDAGSSVRCVCFASAARRVGFRVADGMQVVVTGRLDYYDAQGNLQLYVDAIEPVGQGALELKLRQLTEELRGLGYFDPDRKKPLPLLPLKVAVITSRSGAALQDVINTATKRWPGCRLYLCDVRVQGAAAAPEIAEAINRLSRYGESLGIEAVILTRGGGSIEDLWAFNERVVADAVFRCRLPIVAAIGHETDTTIAELVADVRCATPTQAAMTVIPERAAMLRQVDQLADRATFLLHRRAKESRQRLDALLRHPVFRRPDRLTMPAAEHIDTLSRRLADVLTRRAGTARQRLLAGQARLGAAIPPRVAQATQRIDALGRHLDSISPHRVLDRGYSMTLGRDGKPLRSVNQTSPGDELTTVLADGKVRSRVTDASGGSPLPARPRPVKRKAAEPPGPSLFE